MTTPSNGHNKHCTDYVMSAYSMTRKDILYRVVKLGIIPEIRKMKCPVTKKMIYKNYYTADQISSITGID